MRLVKYEVLEDSQLINKKKRTGRNPKTGEKIEVSEKKTIHFKIAKEFFNKIND